MVIAISDAALRHASGPATYLLITNPKNSWRSQARVKSTFPPPDKATLAYSHIRNWSAHPGHDTSDTQHHQPWSRTRSQKTVKGCYLTLGEQTLACRDPTYYHGLQNEASAVKCCSHAVYLFHYSSIPYCSLQSSSRHQERILPQHSPNYKDTMNSPTSC